LLDYYISLFINCKKLNFRNYYPPHPGDFIIPLYHNYTDHFKNFFILKKRYPVHFRDLAWLIIFYRILIFINIEDSYLLMYSYILLNFYINLFNLPAMVSIFMPCCFLTVNNSICFQEVHLSIRALINNNFDLFGWYLCLHLLLYC